MFASDDEEDQPAIVKTVGITCAFSYYLRDTDAKDDRLPRADRNEKS